MKSILFLFLLISVSSFSQVSGAIYGVVTADDSLNTPIPLVKIWIESQSDSLHIFAKSDFDGKYKISGITPGKVNIYAKATGYDTVMVVDVVVRPDEISVVNLKMNSSQLLSAVCVTSYDTPLIKRGAGSINSVVAGGVIRIRKRDIGKQSISGESYGKIKANSFKKTKNNPLSTFSIDVDKAAYSNMRRFINDGSLPPQDAVRIEEMINYFTYDYPEPKADEPVSITMEYTDCAWNKKHRLVQIGLKGKSIEMDEAPASNFVFLIDVSGSMQSADKLSLLKSGFTLLTDQLRPQDRVSIVVYAGAAGVVLESTPGNEKDKINAAVQQLTAGGSTAGGEGIQKAYAIARENYIKDGNNRVILATDGDFNVGLFTESDLENLIVKEREDNIFLSVLGFGKGNLKDSKMERLADKGNGNYSYIDNIFEAKKVLVTEIGGTLYTIAKDVKLQVEFNPKHVKSYRLIGYENRLLNDEDFNDDKKDAGEMGSGHTVTALYEIVPAGSKEELSSVDPLKYQTISENNDAVNEVLTVKLRYKEPKGSKSKKISKVLYNNPVKLADASDNVRFASAVAQFGLLLRESVHKGNASYQKALDLARSAKGDDENGYRREFINLVEVAEVLSK